MKYDCKGANCLAKLKAPVLLSLPAIEAFSPAEHSRGANKAAAFILAWEVICVSEL